MNSSVSATARFAQKTLQPLPDSGAVENQVAARAMGVFKSYYKSALEIPVLRGVDLRVYSSEFLAIIGQSGSGKSTLLHLMGLLDQPDQGEIQFDGQRVDSLPNANRDRLRNSAIGMIFQFYHLLPEFTALENVLMPAMIAEGFWKFRRRRRHWLEQADHYLELVGLSHRRRHRPGEMSGGEMQRAAIARALIAKPRLLLADEPTGNLDQENGQAILDVLRSLNATHGLTIVMVTHDAAIAHQADRTVRLVDGRVQGS